MKKLSIITAFVAILFCGMTSAMAQNNNSNPAINNFVKQYFPEATVLMVDSDWDEYEVRLSDGTQIEFTRSPDELVPEQIANYVKTSFTNQRIVKIEKKRRSWEIELNSELEIKFDKNFNVIRIDD